LKGQWLARLLFVALAAVADPSIGVAQSVPALFGALAQKVGEIPDIRDKAIGVADFPLPSGLTSELAVFFADQLDVALIDRASAAGFKILARRDLCKVIGENMLWVNDRFDPALAAKLGNLRGVDFLVTGQLTPLGQRASMSVRLIETTSGRAVWAQSITLPLDEGLRGLANRTVTSNPCGGAAAATSSGNALSTAPVGERLHVKIGTDKPSYRIGDAVQFTLRANRDAYVTLINIGTSGDVTVLYPNSFSPNHFVRGGQDVTIPPPNSGFTLTAQAPIGFDQIRAIATEDNVKIHTKSLSGGSTFRSLDRVQTRDLAVTISDVREGIPPEKWAEAVIAVEVKP